MTRSELIEQLSQRFVQLTPHDTELSVRVILDAMTDSLNKGVRVEIRGFGSFSLSYRPPRSGRNPRTGLNVEVLAKWAPHFKAGKQLREKLLNP